MRLPPAVLVLALCASALTSGCQADSMTPPEPAPTTAAQPRAISPGSLLEPRATTSRFVVSSFNVLGNTHTANGGRGMAPGTTRIRWVGDLLRRHRVSVAGLQELQAPQLTVLRRVAPEYAVWPGRRLGQRLTQNSIVWRRDEWRRVDAGTTPIPYFFGREIPMPHVLLRHRATGREVWFLNYHNPARSFGPAAQWRARATELEGRLAARLMVQAPVVMTGDFNAREDFFCQISSLAELHSADGGRRAGETCLPPADPRVDWILGSPAVGFSATVADRSPRVRRTSDHPMLRSTATVTWPEVF